MSDSTNTRLLILGASGATGRELVKQGLRGGHELTVLVRNPAKLTLKDSRLRVVVGDATHADAIGDALTGCDAVLCALGTRSAKSLITTDLITTSMRVLVPSMEEEGVQRLIVESALGVGETVASAPPLARLAFATVLRLTGKDKQRAEAYVRRSSLNWTTVHPPSLTSGSLTGSYKTGLTLNLRGVPKISRADVAQFMLSQLDDTTYSRQAAIVSN